MYNMDRYNAPNSLEIDLIYPNGYGHVPAPKVYATITNGIASATGTAGGKSVATCKLEEETVSRKSFQSLYEEEEKKR